MAAFVYILCVQDSALSKRSNQRAGALGVAAAAVVVVGDLKWAPAERTRLPDWCLTCPLESPDSLQISSEMGRIKTAGAGEETTLKPV